MLQLHMVPTSGDATLLRFVEDGHEVNILVDGGNKTHDCINYLTKLGVERLNLVIASHLDRDHTSGLRRVTGEVQVDEAWITDISPLVKAAAESVYMTCCLAGYAIAVAGASLDQKLAVYEGYETQLGPFYLEVLSPPRSLHWYLRLPEAVERILRSKKGETIRSYVRTLVDNSLEGFDREGRDEMVDADKRVSEVIKRFEMEVPQGIEVQGLVDRDDLDPDYWRDVDKFYGRAEQLFNDISIVVRITYSYRGVIRRFLFPGDLTNWTIMLARHSDLIRRCVLKVPHHGSEISYSPEDYVDFWLSRAVRSFYWGGFGYRWREIWEEWLYGLRRLPPWRRQRVPPTPGLPAWSPPINPDSKGIYGWLSPERALVYPRKSGKSLPKLGVRNALINASDAVSCTFRQGKVDAGRRSASESCVDCYRCVEGSAPVVLEW